jgi:hypothetical protein
MFAQQLIDGINYSLDDEKSEATVVAKDPLYSGNVTIPATVEYNEKTYNVVEIGAEAFNGCVDLTGITLSEGLQTIGFDAFWNCDKLTTVAIPSTVTTIKPYAFEDCDEMAEFTLPNTVTEVGYKIFSGDNKLTQPVYNNTFFAYMPKGYSGAYTIPEGITTIVSNAFMGCEELTSVIMPNSVTLMDAYAFQNCYKLESVTLSENLSVIDGSTFENCKKLQSVVIPASVTQINDYAFSGCSELASVTFKEGLQHIGTGAFASCALTDISIPASVTSMGSAFSSCPLENITIAPGNTHFDSRDDCNAIIKTEDNKLVVGAKNSTIPGSVVSIGSGAFGGLDIASVTLPASVQEIENLAFNSCSQLTSFTLPNTVTSVGDAVFTYSGITEPVYNNTIFAFMPPAKTGAYTIPEGIQVITGNAFQDCNQLTAVTFPSSLQRVGFDAFWHCDALTEVVLPEGLTLIGGYAFEHCDILHKVTLPSTLTEIQQHAFYNCPALDSIIVNVADPLEISADVFGGVDASCKIFVPAGSVAAYSAAPVWMGFDIQSIEDLPTGVENTTANTKAVKRIVNGQLFIERDGKTFNAQGAQVK